MRPLTHLERLSLTLAAIQVRDIDEQLAQLLQQIADGDDAAYPAVYDRLNMLGRFDLADRLKRLVEK